jgi:hypothetical protein
MTFNKLFLIILGVIPLITKAQFQSLFADAKDYKGKVKTIQTELLKIDSSVNKNLYKFTHHYDKEGYLLERVFYDESKNTYTIHHYTHNKKARSVRDEEYSENELKEITISFYNKKDLITKVIYYDDVKNLKKRTENEYHSYGKFKSIFEYNASGKLHRKEVYRYDKKGNLTEDAIFEDDKKKIIESNVYQYNKKGNILVQKQYLNTLQYYTTYVFTYDAKGKVIRCDSTSESFKNYTLYSYPNTGETLEQFFNEKGELLQSIHTIKDTEGRILKKTKEDFMSTNAFCTEEVYDDSHNTYTYKQYKNDTLIYSYTKQYNDKNKLVQYIYTNRNNKTSIENHTYSYDIIGNLVEEVVTDENNRLLYIEKTNITYYE